MKHLKLTFVGLLALNAAASGAFAQGPPGPPPGGPPIDLRSTCNHAYLVLRYTLQHRYELDSPASDGRRASSRGGWV
jgi:hypothetical protein